MIFSFFIHLHIGNLFTRPDTVGFFTTISNEALIEEPPIDTINQCVHNERDLI